MNKTEARTQMDPKLLKKVSEFESPEVSSSQNLIARMSTTLVFPNSGLYSPDLSKCYFLQIHTKICSKVPIFYFNRPKRPPL